MYRMWANFLWHIIYLLACTDERTQAVRIVAVFPHPLNILAVANDASQNREVAVNATGPGWVIGTAVAFMRLMEKVPYILVAI
jgi:hypothetical protein